MRTERIAIDAFGHEVDPTIDLMSTPVEWIEREVPEEDMVETGSPATRYPYRQRILRRRR